MKKAFGFIVFFLMVFFSVYSQRFKYEATFSKVDTTGFYAIFLKPEIISKLNHNFSDLRIFDDHNHQIPYLNRMGKEISQSTRSEEYKIIENKHRLRKGYTRFVIHNKLKKPVDNIGIVVKNTEAEYVVKISGSDDNKKWYVIKDDFPVNMLFSKGETAELRILDIPNSKFEYYELIIFDNKGKQAEVLKAVYYETSTEDLKYIKLTNPLVLQDDRSRTGKSVVTVVFNEPQYIDKLVFDIDGPAYYLRKAELTKGDSAIEKKMKVEFYDQAVKIFHFTSQQLNVLDLSRYKAKVLRLIIDNKDDSPLKIKTVNAYQIKNYLIAYLNSDTQYYLRFGNANLEIPIYDLKYFSDSIPANLPGVHIAQIVNLNDQASNPKLINIPPAYLWLIIGIIALLLVVISLKMFKEILR